MILLWYIPLLFTWASNWCALRWWNVLRYINTYSEFVWGQSRPWVKNMEEKGVSMVTFLKITVTQPVKYLSFNMCFFLKMSNTLNSWFTRTSDPAVPLSLNISQFHFPYNTPHFVIIVSVQFKACSGFQINSGFGARKSKVILCLCRRK